MNLKQAVHSAAALSVALAMSASYAADQSTMSTRQNGATTPPTAMTGTTNGGVLGHEGANPSGKMSTSSPDRVDNKSSMTSDSNTVRDAQAALNDQGYKPGSIDGQWGSSTKNAVRRFQSEHGLPQSGELDSATLEALGVKS